MRPTAYRSLDGWTQGATVNNPFGETGSFVTYTNGAARLLIESEVQVYTGADRSGDADGGAGLPHLRRRAATARAIRCRRPGT